MMMRTLSPSRILLVLIFCFFGALSSRAQPDLEMLSAPLDIFQLTWDERRVLQLALSLAGDYNGMLDGDWGGLSSRALSAWSERNFDRTPINLDAAFLVFNLLERLGEDGWSIIDFPESTGSVLFPVNAWSEQSESDSFRNWAHNGSSLRYAFARSDLNDALSYHNYIFSLNRNILPPYLVRHSDRMVTRVIKEDNGVIYARSDKIFGAWRTIILSAEAVDADLVRAVAASISPLPSRPLRLPEDGVIQRAFHDFVAIAVGETENSTGENNEPVDRTLRGVARSGSGFIVNNAGIVMTNRHVVEGCEKIIVDNFESKIISLSINFDIAILYVNELKGRGFAIFSPKPASINEDVTASGFPYFGILDGLNVTRGVVSSTNGFGGDIFGMQISAPVQPGNSGGPLLDERGHVVGVVTARISQDFIARAYGSLPENVNFAVTGEAAKLFLSQQGVEGVQIADGTEPRLSGAAIGLIAREITVLVECRR